jgi:hypothetical protein
MKIKKKDMKNFFAIRLDAKLKAKLSKDMINI